MSDEARPAEYCYLPEYRTLSICTTCFGLFDDESLGPLGREQQLCACAPSRGDRWPGYDYNERARLCDCCGRYVLRSGSRWSVWFCDECKARVLALNGEVGFPLIPIGRHSMMNGVGLGGAVDEKAIARFEARLGGLVSRMELLSRTWKPEHLRAELVRLGLLDGEGAGGAGAVPLAVYLGAVADEDGARGVQPPSGVDQRHAAFLELRDVFGAPD